MRNNFLIATLLVISAALLYMLFIKPWFITAQEKYSHIQQLNGLLQSADQIQQKRDELQAQKARLPEEKERRIREAVPENTPENKIQFFISLDKMLAQSGFAPDISYAVGAEQKEGDSGVIIPVSFSFGQVSYDIIRGFINNLQRWERSVRIRSVKINSGGAFETPQLIGGAVIVIEVLFSDAPGDNFS